MNKEIELDNLLGINGKEAQSQALDILTTEAEMENRSQEEIQEFRDKCISAIAEGEKLFRYLARLADTKYLAQNRSADLPADSISESGEGNN